jgi:hypothetical protein
MDYKNIEVKFGLEGIEQIPEIIFKFRDWENDFHKRLLLNNELYSSDFESLNDPFDGSIIVNHKLVPVSREDVKNLLGLEDNLPIPLNEIIGNASKSLVSQMDQVLKSSLKQTGVISFTSDKKNILLWSHYANSHRGFAVGFDTKKLSKAIGELKLESFIKSIYYSDKYPKIEFEFNLFKNPDNMLKFKAIIQSLTTKSKQWYYEEEVRILTFAKNKIKINLPSDCIKEINLGFKMDEKALNEIIKIRNLRFPNAIVYQCKKSTDNYEISFHQI